MAVYTIARRNNAGDDWKNVLTGNKDDALDYLDYIDSGADFREYEVSIDGELLYSGNAYSCGYMIEEPA